MSSSSYGAAGNYNKLLYLINLADSEVGGLENSLQNAKFVRVRVELARRLKGDAISIVVIIFWFTAGCKVSIARTVQRIPIPSHFRN